LIPPKVLLLENNKTNINDTKRVKLTTLNLFQLTLAFLNRPIKPAITSIQLMSCNQGILKRMTGLFNKIGELKNNIAAITPKLAANIAVFCRTIAISAKTLQSINNRLFKGKITV
jgi:hypothetical protein